MTDNNSNKIQNKSKRTFYLLVASGINVALMVILLILSFFDGTLINSISKILLILLILFFCVEVFALLKFFKGLKLIEINAEHLSDGNLNISDIMADRTKGIEVLTIAFNDMKRNLLNFIDSTKGNVVILSEAVDQVTKSLDMTYKGNEQIAKNMNIVAEKAHDQLNMANQTLAQIEDVSNRTLNISNTLANIEEFVLNTVKETEEGTTNVNKYDEQMNVISTNLNNTSIQIETLNSYLNEIDQVSGLIMTITEQLKLLSLNSAVEAARAGDAGKGFVVVSQEMNKLSTATRNSIGEINRLLNNILNSNEQVSISIDACVESFEISKDIFKSVQESFDNINKNTNILSEDMKKVHEESQIITDSTHDMNEQGLSLHRSSKEISSITQDVAAVTEEELAENEEINNQALSLQNLLSSIETLLRRYKTSVEPIDEVSPRKLKLVMLSPLDHPFWHGVREGALYAKNELRNKNTEVEYIGYEVMDDRLNNTLAEKIKEGVDGIVVPGSVGQIEDNINQAYLKNIPVVSFNQDFPDGVNRLAYFGPDIEATATVAGKLVVNALDGQGEFAIIRGELNGYVETRQNAILKVTDKKSKIKMVEDLETKVGDEYVYDGAKELLKRNQDLKVIVILTSGIQGAVDAIKDSGRHGKTKVICFDYDDQVLENIKDGYIYAALGQDPFGQGHDPLISLYNHIVGGIKPDDITHTRIEVIDRRSVD